MPYLCHRILFGFIEIYPNKLNRSGVSRAFSDIAIVIIGRTAGEDQDNNREKGSFYITDTERNNIFNRAFEVLGR